MFNDAQFQARQMIERAPLSDGSTLAVPALVPKLSVTPGGTRWLGPKLGAHPDEVLRGLGLSEEQIEALRRERVI